nr:lipopolysaccharide biosynthesis protein [Deinococcus betulae]
MSRLSSPYAKNLLTTLIRAVGQLLIFAVLTRIIPPSEYGQYFVALSIIAIVNALVDLGSYNLVFLLNSKYQNLERVVSELVTHLAAIMFPGILIVLLLNAVLQLGIPLGVLILAGIIDIMTRMIMVFVAANMIDEHYQKIFFFESVGLIIKAAALLIAVGWKTDLTEWLFALAAANLLMLTFAWKYLFQGRRVTLKIPALYRTFWKEASPFAISNALVGVSSELEKPIMSRLLSFSDVAVYSIGQRIFSIGSMPVSAWLATRYAGFFTSESPAEKKRLIQSAAYPALIIAGAVILTLAAVVSLDVIGLVFGRDYEKAGLLMLIMSSSYLFQAAYLPMADYLSGTGRQPLRLKIQAISTVAYLIGAVFWIPRLNTVGAAINVVEFHLLSFIIYSVVVGLQEKRGL